MSKNNKGNPDELYWSTNAITERCPISYTAESKGADHVHDVAEATILNQGTSGPVCATQSQALSKTKYCGRQTKK